MTPPKLVDEVSEAMRVLMAHAVLFHDAIARRAGLNAIDLQCLNLLLIEGPLTPGALAGKSGLTAGGAITAAIDRLERAGFVKRTRDHADRRKVTITADAKEAWQRIGPLYGGIQSRWVNYLTQLSEEQLRFAVEFLSTAASINQAETANLREPDQHRPDSAISEAVSSPRTSSRNVS